ncbi:MAG: hypothetical protein HGA25_10915, partial [Clostridiales bacterium]|nr:hypothetical protein [Clostridiales bacterium]
MDRQIRLVEIEKVIKAGPYRADWNSLTEFAVPEWFEKAKFGIFIHWGLYSIPGWHEQHQYQRCFDEGLVLPSVFFHLS